MIELQPKGDPGQGNQQNGWNVIIQNVMARFTRQVKDHYQSAEVTYFQEIKLKTIQFILNISSFS